MEKMGVRRKGDFYILLSRIDLQLNLNHVFMFLVQFSRDLLMHLTSPENKKC